MYMHLALQQLIIWGIGIRYLGLYSHYKWLDLNFYFGKWVLSDLKRGMFTCPIHIQYLMGGWSGTKDNFSLLCFSMFSIWEFPCQIRDVRFKGPIFIWLEEAWKKISHILNLLSSTPRTLSQFLMMSHKQMDVFSCSHVFDKIILIAEEVNFLYCT